MATQVPTNWRSVTIDPMNAGQAYPLLSGNSRRVLLMLQTNGTAQVWFGDIDNVSPTIAPWTIYSLDQTPQVLLYKDWGEIIRQPIVAVSQVGGGAGRALEVWIA